MEEKKKRSFEYAAYKLSGYDNCSYDKPIDDRYNMRNDYLHGNIPYK